MMQSNLRPLVEKSPSRSQGTAPPFQPYANMVTVRVGRTVNLGDYNSLRVDATIEAIPPVMDKQNPRPYIRRLYHLLDQLVGDLTGKGPAYVPPLPPDPPGPGPRQQLQQQQRFRRPTP